MVEHRTVPDDGCIATYYEPLGPPEPLLQDSKLFQALWKKVLNG